MNFSAMVKAMFNDQRYCRYELWNPPLVVPLCPLRVVAYIKWEIVRPHWSLCLHMWEPCPLYGYRWKLYIIWEYWNRLLVTAKLNSQHSSFFSLLASPADFSASAKILIQKRYLLFAHIFRLTNPRLKQIYLILITDLDYVSVPFIYLSSSPHPKIST